MLPCSRNKPKAFQAWLEGALLVHCIAPLPFHSTFNAETLSLIADVGFEVIASLGGGERRGRHLAGVVDPFNIKFCLRDIECVRFDTFLHHLNRL